MQKENESTKTIESFSTINTGGGAGVQGNVHTSGGNFVGRDSIVTQNHYYIGYMASPQPFSDVLSAEEEKLLIAASRNSGEILQLHIEQIGHYVRVGGQSFFDEKDPEFAALYLDALKSLCRRNYVNHVEKALYSLTGSGWKKAREVTR